MQEVSRLAVERRGSEGEELLSICPSCACGIACLPELRNSLQFLPWYYVTWMNRLVFTDRFLMGRAKDKKNEEDREVRV